MSTPFAAELTVAITAARAAGVLLSEAFEAGPRPVDRAGVDQKGTSTLDLVTEVDKACEAAIRKVLDRDTPDVPVLGEEEGGAWDGGTRWVIDPIDGTTNFVHGFPWFAVSVGLEVDGQRAVGVILEPIRKRLYTATRGGGAFVDGSRMAVSTTASLGQALLATGFPYDRRERVDVMLGIVRAALMNGQGLRRAGAACLDLAMVAEGRLDAYFELNLRPWDLAAGALLVEEAGGRVTALDGTSPLQGAWPAPLASNGLLHDAVARMLDGLVPA